jgi:hypothetical protein
LQPKISIASKAIWVPRSAADYGAFTIVSFDRHHSLGDTIV